MMPSSMPRPVLAVMAGLLWIAWCFLVVTTLLPAILRKLTIWPGTSAYVLCLLPLIGLAAWWVTVEERD